MVGTRGPRFGPTCFHLDLMSEIIEETPEDAGLAQACMAERQLKGGRAGAMTKASGKSQLDLLANGIARIYASPPSVLVNECRRKERRSDIIDFRQRAAGGGIPLSRNN